MHFDICQWHCNNVFQHCFSTEMVCFMSIHDGRHVFFMLHGDILFHIILIMQLINVNTSDIFLELGNADIVWKSHVKWYEGSLYPSGCGGWTLMCRTESMSFKVINMYSWFPVMWHQSLLQLLTEVEVLALCCQDGLIGGSNPGFAVMIMLGVSTTPVHKCVPLRAFLT